MKPTSSLDAQSLFSMTENDSDGNVGKKQKGKCDVSLLHAISASFFDSRQRDGGSADRLVQNAIFGKNVDRVAFGSDLVKLEQKTRKDIGDGTSGEPQLRFITWIQVNLYLVTTRS